MNSYTKPNTALHIGLHDARITGIHIGTITPGNQGGAVTLAFDEGLTLVRDGSASRTGKATVSFSRIDYDFSHVYVFTEGRRQEMGFDELAKEVQDSALEVVSECYGYNQTILSCSICLDDGWHEAELVICHLEETLYEWLD
jgi:hypothetical protein